MEALRLGGIHLRPVVRHLAGQRGDRVQRGLHARPQHAGPRRAQRGQLGHVRRAQLEPADVRDRLHEEPVRRGAAVGEDAPRRHPGARPHHLQHVADLVRHRFQGRADDVRLRRVRGHPQDGRPRVRAPVRRAEPGERRHEIHAAVVLHRLREGLGFGGGPGSGRAGP